jgi:hypothetical protein
MAFDLEIQFTGLFLYLLHTDGDRAKAVMVNARQSQRRRGRAGNKTHPDTTRSDEPHVGYLRFNLGSLDSRFPSDEDNDGPDFEVIHRLDAVDVSFPQIARSQYTMAAQIPNLDEAYPGLEPDPAIFRNPPSDEVLARIELNGGTWSGHGMRSWEFKPNRRHKKPPYQGNFAPVISWTRSIDAAQLEVVIQPFDSGASTTLELQPIRDKVVLRIANLCSVNPLEWNELKSHKTAVDADFKWVYHLLKLPDGKRTEELPVPGLIAELGLLGEEDGCHGGLLITDYP